MPADRITVTSSDGDFEVCAASGVNLTPKTKRPLSFMDVVRVDVDEYRQWCAEKAIAPAESVDVLCLGLVITNNDGTEFTDPAEEDFREILLEVLAEVASTRVPDPSPREFGWTPRSMHRVLKDGKPILALCRHDADPYFDEAKGRLTDYGSHCEGMAHVPDGWHVVEWVQGGEEFEGLFEPSFFRPGGWFLSGSEGETPANPVAWLPIPLDYEHLPARQEAMSHAA